MKKGFKLGKNQEKWLRALESGKFRRAVGVLANPTKTGKMRYCCLGVACEVSGLGKWEDGIYLGNDVVLPVGVQDWLGAKNREGVIPKDDQSGLGEHISLTFMNDNGVGFKKIASTIRKFPGVFFNESK